MNRIIAPALTKPRRISSAKAATLRLTGYALLWALMACAMAVVAILASGNAFAQQMHVSKAEEQAGYKYCRDALGPLGVPVWTADGTRICIKISTKG